MKPDAPKSRRERLAHAVTFLATSSVASGLIYLSPKWGMIGSGAVLAGLLLFFWRVGERKRAILQGMQHDT